MNFIYRHVSSALSSILHGPQLVSQPASNILSPLAQASPLLSWSRGFEWKPDPRRVLESMLRRGPHIKKPKIKNPLGYNVPFAKGVVLKTLIKKPKKPNSANRKCVLVRLSSGKEMTAYVPGIGHNLQEHNVVLVRVGRLKDVPGVKIKCVRGKYDLPHVVKQPQK